jgi:hypothetical protein
MHNVFSNKTILFDNLDFWCQLVVIRFVKTLSKRRMFVSSMKISAWWLLHRWIKFNKICWEKRPAKTRPNLRTSFWRRDLKNTQPHVKTKCSCNIVFNQTGSWCKETLDRIPSQYWRCYLFVAMMFCICVLFMSAAVLCWSHHNKAGCCRQPSALCIPCILVKSLSFESTVSIENW